MLTKLIVVIILQYMEVKLLSCIPYTVLYVNYISIKLGVGETNTVYFHWEKMVKN